MTIDKQKLKALAQAVADLEDMPEREDEHAEAFDALWLNLHCHTILTLLAEIERLEKVNSFQDAVACVFDFLKFAAANTNSKEWDDQLEELASEVIDFAPTYKKQWKDITAMASQLDQLKSENAALRNDAERYRWLKQQRSPAWKRAAEVPMNHTDAHIDAAMGREAK